MRGVWAFLLALGEFYPAMALNPGKALTQYSITLWTQQHGLPQDTIRAIAQTADGYLWLGTDEGLARFDGYEFVTFSRDRGQLPSNSVVALAADRNGSLWIGTPGGLTQYRDKRFRTYTQKEGLPGAGVSSLFVDHGGVLWIVAGGNLSRFDGNTFTNFLREREIPMKSIRGVTEDDRHTLYVTGINSVTRYVDGKFVAVFEPETLQADFPAGTLVDHAGNLWVLGVRGLIRRSPDGQTTRYGARQGLSDSFGLSAILQDRDGNIWVGTDGGLARFEDGRFRTRTEEAGDHGAVRCLFEDREGNLWMGSSNGLKRLRDDVFTVYGKDEGLPSDEPNAVFQDRRGNIWVGFLDAGLRRFSPGISDTGSAPAGLANGRVYSIRETRDGEMLVSGREGLTRVKNGIARTFVPPDPQGRKRVYDALQDSRGRLWLALPNGLAELRGEELRSVIPAASPVMLESSFVTLAEDRDGSLWAGTIRGGLWHIAAGGSRLYTMSDGLGSDQIRSLYQDPDGTLWVGTLGGGLNAFRAGRFVRYSARDGLLSDNISKILDDGSSLWLSTTRGICRISKKQLGDFTARRIRELSPVNYGVGDGLRRAQAPPEIGAGGSRHSDGSLWFVTTRGIAVYKPHQRSQTELPPPIHLAETAIAGRPIDWNRAPKLPPGDGRLEIRYSAIHLSAPDRVQYSYKLDGLDSDWVRADARRLVNYNSLGHGHYRFAVRAELPGGAVSEQSYQFDILPHFYETGWFRLLAFLSLGAACWMVYEFRVRQIRSRFDAVLKERLRLAREIHDTLAQAFVGISSQLDALETCLPDDSRPAQIYLDLARRMAQHSLTEARRSVMDLRSADLDNQDLAAALESGTRHWTAGSGVQVEVDVSGNAQKLPDEVEQHVLRIAQEAVTNALKHASPRTIAVNLHLEPKKLKLRVADNGCGFEQEDVFASMGGHFGLIGMRERAERLGGELRLDSQPGMGTQVEVTVPLP